MCEFAMRNLISKRNYEYKTEKTTLTIELIMAQ